MKCEKCGAQLDDGVLFCRECGNKVEKSKRKRFCRECGAEYHQGAKYCLNCGSAIEMEEKIVSENETTVTITNSDNMDRTGDVSTNSQSPNGADKVNITENIKKCMMDFWDKQDVFMKCALIAGGVTLVLVLTAVFSHKILPVLFVLLQVGSLIVAVFMHKGIIKTDKNCYKYLTLAGTVLLIILGISSYTWGAKTSLDSQVPTSTNQGSDEEETHVDWGNLTLSKLLPKPKSDFVELLYNGDDWLSVIAHDVSENDYLEYVRLCKEDYGFAVESTSFDDCFFAYNQKGDYVTLLYIEMSKELNIELMASLGNIEEQSDDASDVEEEKQPYVTEQPIQTEEPKQTEQSENSKEKVTSIAKGAEYAYMTDEWNVYIATAISDDIIKVANWDKTMSNSQSVEHDYDVGAFKINDSENGFEWVDDEHTAFVLTFKDKNNSKFRKGATATFTINISDSDKNKGSNYSEDIACFSYQNDEWHLYRAIPLTETLLKIETWNRGSSIGTFLFGYDLCLIDTTSDDTDFAWTDDEHTSFSITMRDEENKYEWKKETFVVFSLENEGYTNFDVKSYLSKWEVGDGEVAVPASASDYKYENYQDVQKDLEDAGFTNITTKILYDIVWGWTEEGEVKSVSIDGRSDYIKNEVFNMDAPIVITYHMKEEDDPNSSTEAELEENKTEDVKPIENLTVDNCPELAKILANKAEIDESYTEFAKQYAGQLIEFDGRIDYCVHHGNYKTRFDYLVSAGDYDPDNQVGPTFKFEDVSYYDLNTDLDTVSVGLNVHIVAEVVSFNSNNGLFFLEPVSVTSR